MVSDHISPSTEESTLQYDAKLCGLLDDYDRAFIVHADNVGSKQFMDIRRVSYSHRSGVRMSTQKDTGGVLSGT